MGKIKTVDFRARTDRIVYILQHEGKGYVVVNNDSGMCENSREVSGKGERENLVARLIPENWRKLITKKEVEVQGFNYCPRSCLSLGQGRIQANNLNSYTTSNLYLFRRHRSTIALIVQSIDSAIMESLEHFLVPKNVANEMRAYALRYKTVK